MVDLGATQVEAALAAVRDAEASDAEKADMLVELAMGMQMRPKSTDDLRGAILLYEHAHELLPTTGVLDRARVRARLATALQALPDGGDALSRARQELDDALLVLRERGLPEEVAEAEMNLGLVLQTLASEGRAPITDAIGAYQRALRTFQRDSHATEFAILHNNLATAFLSMPMTDERGRLREALAVQSFEEALRVVTLVDHPTEYAMLQNNLGNALQYASSSHLVENNLRALKAYDEALKVRTARDTPVAYANTIANKANALRNLPVGADGSPEGRRENLRQARDLYREAQSLFVRNDQLAQAHQVESARLEVERELLGLEEDPAERLPGGGA